MGLVGLFSLDLGDDWRLFLCLFLGGVASLFMNFVMGFWLMVPAEGLVRMGLVLGESVVGVYLCGWLFV